MEETINYGLNDEVERIREIKITYDATGLSEGDMAILETMVVDRVCGEDNQNDPNHGLAGGTRCRLWLASTRDVVFDDDGLIIDPV